MVHHTLSPIYDCDSKILILGTMPSPKSRELGFYYYHPQNRFWQVLSKVFNEEIDDTISGKTDFLHRHKIALWDVLKSCDIKNAKDSTIKNPVANDLRLIYDNAEIKAVFTTGKKAEELYKKYCEKQQQMPKAIYLPSTSPANQGNYSLDKLLESYKIILEYVS